MARVPRTALLGPFEPEEGHALWEKWTQAMKVALEQQTGVAVSYRMRPKHPCKMVTASGHPARLYEALALAVQWLRNLQPQQAPLPPPPPPSGPITLAPFMPWLQGWPFPPQVPAYLHSTPPAPGAPPPPPPQAPQDQPIKIETDGSGDDDPPPAKVRPTTRASSDRKRKATAATASAPQSSPMKVIVEIDRSIQFSKFENKNKK